jgi:3-hydroxyisobutyrate dehydrogenase-like beta-hydroxyacid dehydrogenase
MMGSAMCGHLAGANLGEVLIHDLVERRVERVVELGAIAAGSNQAVAEAADIVSTCVPAAQHIEVVIDDLELVAKPGQVLLIHSTVHPATIRAAQARMATWGGHVFDACVAGGNEAAREGQLAIFAGGLSDAPDAVHELLDVFGSKVIDAGPVGAGAALKIGVNVMTYAQFAAAAIAHDGVAASGGNPQALLEAWRHTGMLGALTENFSGMLGLAPADLTGGFREMIETQVGIGEKDLELATELGDPPEAVIDVVRSIQRLMPAVYRTITMEEA